MAQIDPNIILNAVQQQRSGSSPFGKLQEIIQFQQLLDQKKSRDAATQKKQTISDLIGKHTQQTPEGISLNNAPFIQDLAGIDPQAALEQQAIVNQQKAQAEKVKAEELTAIANASEAQLKKARSMQGAIGSAAGAVLNAEPENQQQILDEQLDRLIDLGVITKEMLQSGKIPTVINPQSLASLRAIQQASLSSKEQLDFEIKNREAPKGIKETPADKSIRERDEEQDVFKSQIDSRFVDKLKPKRRLNKESVKSKI